MKNLHLLRSLALASARLTAMSVAVQAENGGSSFYLQAQCVLGASV